MKRSINLNDTLNKSFFSITLLLCYAIGFSQPMANFNSSAVSGCAPLTINFHDLSTGTPTSWQWNLGNTILSTEQSPTTTYFNAGTYTVSLKVSNASGSDSILKTEYITVYNKPTANFTASTVSGCFPLNVNFIDQSSSGSGSIATWSWDFGDGDISSLQNPHYTYTAAGTYTVTLKVTNTDGCFQVLNNAKYINVPDGVITNFTSSNPQHCNPPETINFTNLSTGPSVLSYQWNFGNGNTSILPNPSNTYLAGGTYSVQLIVKSSEGCTDTLLKQDSITIRDFQANFSVPDSVCIKATAIFNNISIPAATSSIWSFGDGTGSAINNPTKVWNIPATYQVKLVNNYGVCSDSIIKPVTVLAFPIANFSAMDTFNCKAPFTTQFNNLSTGGTTWLWNFGDGSTSTLQNPSHTYNSAGQFMVMLITSNATSCNDTLIKNAYIKVTNPVFLIVDTPAGGCIPFIFNPQIKDVNDPNGIASVLWDFGDGNSSMIVSPSHTYIDSGSYIVKLYVTTNDGCANTVMTAVKTGKPSLPDFTAAPLIQCVGQNIQFTNTSTGAIDSLIWNFGDGTTSTLQNPSHAYLENGTFTVDLIALNNGCPDSLTKNNLVKALPPVTNFTPTFSCANKTQVTFTDNSVMPQTWSWNFGDGGISNIQNPVHTYAAMSNYNVTLTVTNAGCTDSKTYTIQLIDENPDFTIDGKDSICTNTSIGFMATNITTANIKYYLWNYGDGASTGGPGNTGLHTYTSPGTYSVSLTTTDTHGCDTTINKSGLIYVHGPTANFTASPIAGCKGLNITFSDNSSTSENYPIVKWQWHYGDGVTQILNTPPFNHTYDTAGSFIPQLKITDAYGCVDSVISSVPIQVTNPIAVFNSPDTLACIGSNVTFNNTSDGINLVYAWTLGNGILSSQATPSTYYNVDSNYSVKLVVTDINGCQDSLQLNNYIKVKTEKANFTINDSISSCSPFEVDFSNTSINTISQTWNFGDGSISSSSNPIHYYSTPGTYTATLYAVGQGNCVDSFKRTIQLFSSAATLTYTPVGGCSPMTANFNVSTAGPVQYFWDFGDGNTASSTAATITNNYLSPGNYIPKVILTDPTGCQIPVTGVDTIHLTKSYANFVVPDSDACNGTTIAFTDSSTGNATISSWHWNFGDGDTSILQNPTHLYIEAGTYNVQLIVYTTDGCSDTLTKNNYIHIYGPVAKFGVSALSNCSAINILFSDSSVSDGTNAITQWQFNFGDGLSNSYTSPPFTHAYDTAGDFIPQLKIIDAFGCTDSFTLSTPILITSPKAGFNSTDTLSCIGNNVLFNNTSSGINLTYAWSLDTGVTSSLQNPVASYTTNGSYSIKLVVTDSIGCKDSLQLDNYIKTNTPTASFTVSDSTSTCSPFLVHFTNTTNNGASYVWNFGDGTSSDSVSCSHTYTIAGMYIVTLIATGLDGCVDSTTHSIQLYSIGTLTYSPETSCSELTVNFHITTPVPINYFWSFGDGDTLSSTLATISHNYTIPGNYVPEVTEKDPSGCQVIIAGSDTIHVTKSFMNFTVADSSFCTGTTSTFINATTSTGIVNSWHWDFGDGNTSLLKSPAYIYNTPGVYPVRLIANTANGCSDTLLKNNYIIVNAIPEASVNGDTSSCIKSLLTFSGSLLYPDTSILSWQWNFGNGGSSNSQNPSAQQYNDSGNFALSLIVSSINSGCADTINKTVVIHPLPTTDAGYYPSVCMGSPIQLQATGADNYNWSPATYLNCTLCASPISTPADTILYHVTGSTLFGCQTTDSVLIAVNKKFILTVTPNSDSLCFGQSVQLSANGADNYVWSPATGLNNYQIMDPLADPENSTTYKVIGSDKSNCFKDSASINISVFPNPIINGGTDTTIELGTSALLNLPISGNIATYLWSPPDGLNDPTLKNPSANPNTKTTYQLTATTAEGCTASGTITVNVFNGFVMPNAFTPNGDGLNDLFRIPPSITVKINYFVIYNRWGNQVFYTTNASSGWDGNYNGQPQSTGTYTWIIEYIDPMKQDLKQLKGTVILVR